MLNLLRRSALLCCGIAVAHIPAAHAIVAMTVGSDSVVPGGSASIDLELATHEDIYSFELVLGYDPDQLTLTSYTAGELVSDWGSEGLSWTDDGAEGSLSLTASALEADPVSWTVGELMALQFAVADEAEIGSTLPISVTSAVFYDEAGAVLLSFVEAGQITILDPDAEPIPPPPVFTVSIPDVEASPGDAIWLSIEVDNPASFLALEFELWVDGTMVGLDPDREAVPAERASVATAFVEASSADVIGVVFGVMDFEVPVPAGTGELLSIPLLIPEDAALGVRSLNVTGGSAFGADYSTIEVTGTGAVLTIVAPEIGDTGDTGDPADPVDTGDSDHEGEVDTGLEEEDPGGIDPDEDDADAVTDDEKSGCGCSSAPGPGGWVFLAALGAVLYRRRL